MSSRWLARAAFLLVLNLVAVALSGGRRSGMPAREVPPP